MHALRNARLGLIAAACLLSGCGTTEPASLRLDIAIDKNVVDISDSVRVTLTLTNATPHAVRVLPADAYGVCMHAFEVFDSAGRQVTPPAAFCIAVASLLAPQVVELGPLERVTIRDWWVVAQSRVNGELLSPGVYRLRGAVAGDATMLHSASELVQVLGGAASF